MGFHDVCKGEIANMDFVGSLGVGFWSGINLVELENHGILVIASLISVVRASGTAQKEVLCKNRPGNLLAVGRTCGVAGILGLD